MSSDNEFEDAFVNGVRTALRTGVADVSASPTLLAAVRRRYARRVAARRSGMAAVPLAAAVSLTPIVAAPGMNPFGPGPSASPGPVDTASVTARVTEALNNAQQSVVYGVTTSTGNTKYSSSGQRTVFERWVAGDSSAVRTKVTVDGTAVADMSLGPNGGAFVDHREQIWWPYPPGGADGSYLTEVLTPAQIEQAIADGRLQAVDRGDEIDGTETITLRGDDAIPLTGPVRIWVNESTYLPIRYQHRGPDGEWSNPTDFTWLPPTAENVALLEAPIPDGFERR